MYNKILILLLITLAFGTATAQTGGISASKLAAMCVEPVPQGKIEFEPAYSTYWAKEAWDDEQHLTSLFANPDSINFSSQGGFRFSYGAFTNMEMGFNVPFDASWISMGAKYKFWAAEKLSMAGIGGVALSLGNGNYATAKNSMDRQNSFTAGLITSLAWSDKSSFDLDCQYQHTFLPNKGVGDQFYVNFDWGYYIFDGIQPVLSFNYTYTSEADGSNAGFAEGITPGITIETAENFIVVVAAPLALAGRNSTKTSGIMFALTICLD